jgi:hypothetical protein
MNFLFLIHHVFAAVAQNVFKPAPQEQYKSEEHLTAEYTNVNINSVRTTSLLRTIDM